ncbi:MAG: hypothetical protein IJ606_04730 [Bacteroidaceae bacterium]|nr:hypothetical protein [Bacteroidaceae bacterium]
MFGFSTLGKFAKGLLYRSQYGITEEECERGIRTACDFFGIPMPRAIEDLTRDPQGATMFKNWDDNRFDDDVLCYDLQQLKRLGVNNYTGFTAVFTHECAHRYFQGRLLPGPDFGQWEGELVADYFMGVRASLEEQDIAAIIDELAKQCTGSGTHPTGELRRKYVIYGKQEGYYHLIKGLPFDIEEYFRLFLEYRLNHIDELRAAELMVY